MNSWLVTIYQVKTFLENQVNRHLRRVRHVDLAISTQLLMYRSADLAAVVDRSVEGLGCRVMDSRTPVFRQCVDVVKSQLTARYFLASSTVHRDKQLALMESLNARADEFCIDLERRGKSQSHSGRDFTWSSASYHIGTAI